MAVPHSGQNLHELDREPNLKNAVSFQYNRLGTERLFTQNIIQSRSRPPAFCPPQGTPLWYVDTRPRPRVSLLRGAGGGRGEGTGVGGGGWAVLCLAMCAHSYKELFVFVVCILNTQLHNVATFKY